MNWTDEELAERQAEETCTPDWPTWKGEDAKQRDLYRLARLGLAAEAVGREAFKTAPGDFLVSEDEARHYNLFCDHSAWEERR